jgi:hypothetical protein
VEKEAAMATVWNAGRVSLLVHPGNNYAHTWVAFPPGERPPGEYHVLLTPRDTRFAEEPGGVGPIFVAMSNPMEDGSGFYVNVFALRYTPKDKEIQVEVDWLVLLP